MESYGYGVRTTDGIIGTSGTAKRVGGIFVVDDGSASTVKFYDGTGTGGTLVFQVTTTAGVPINLAFPDGGIVFKGGCYIDLDTHTVLATVAYSELK